jgi:hypothetical protein
MNQGREVNVQFTVKARMNKVLFVFSDSVRDARLEKTEVRIIQQAKLN